MLQKWQIREQLGTKRAKSSKKEKRNRGCEELTLGSEESFERDENIKDDFQIFTALFSVRLTFHYDKIVSLFQLLFFDTQYKYSSRSLMLRV